MTDNDVGAWKSIVNAARKAPERDITVWREAGAAWSVKDVVARRTTESAVEIVVTGDLPSIGAKYAVTYAITGAGAVTVRAAYQPGSVPLAMIPRAGTELVVSPGLERMTWYGRGGETYIDRQFEPIATYASTVAAEFHNYPRPQENGNKTDVRWMTLTNAQGIGLRVSAGDGPPLSLGASHVTKRDLEQAAYAFQLPRRAEIYLNVDWKQMGVGGINSWSATGYPMEAYRIPADQPHEVRYTLSPVGARAK
jgi:beta-galactosidase